ncbi:ribonuclease E inhibitor RraB [Zophobihabitans entericus]|uniref:Regulator of ribonuclease activity B n=1 Tax=Zophobihabitans entericus TaxID=1635327 RepID=A0A6G9ID05_9GAMM|nr:ribonuclease E inhibitor RraB [Zophobihabitans entericus]QIQ22103.1 ribonuclease E inhibitor RraB [Zophobihabitans entericus]
MNSKIALEQQETENIIDELLADGSDPDAFYLIEHHLSSPDFDKLEKVAVEAFKLGYEATDPEEFLDENDNTLICCDIVSEVPLDAKLINAQIAQLIELAEKFGVNYDGWGTYFEGEDDASDDEYDYSDDDEDIDGEDYDSDDEQIH